MAQWWSELDTGPIQTSTPFNYAFLLRNAEEGTPIVLNSPGGNTYHIAVLASATYAETSHGFVRAFNEMAVPLGNRGMVKLTVGLGGNIEIHAGWV